MWNLNFKSMNKLNRGFYITNIKIIVDILIRIVDNSWCPIFYILILNIKFVENDQIEILEIDFRVY